MADNEFEAIQKTYEALAALDVEAQQRVLTYVSSRLGLNSAPKAPKEAREGATDDRSNHADTDNSFEEFGELFDAVKPSTDAEKALAAAYWVLEHDGSDSFNSQSVNSELKNLGHGIAKVTRAIDSLVAQKPSLVIQTKKSGATKQARKTFKITRAGIDLIKSRINAAS